MIKTLRFIAVAALMTVCGAVSAQTTFNFKDIYGNIEPAGNDKTTLYLLKAEAGNGKQTIGDITMSFEEGVSSGAPAYINSSSTQKTKDCIRIYGGKKNNGTLEGSSIQFTKTGDNMKKIVFTATTTEPGGANFKASTGELKMDSKTRDWTWTGDANDVTFTVCQKEDATTVVLRFTEVTVYTTPTGITSVTTDTAKNGARYNLAGQRVNDSYKGVVIENGKKKIVK